MSDILILGMGKVGLATKHSLPLASIEFHDPYKGISAKDPYNYDYAIVCVDTLQRGADDYEDLDAAIDYLNEYSGTIVIRSTLSPDKALEIKSRITGSLIVFPEFMDHNDFKNNTDSSLRTVLGGNEKDIRKFFDLMIVAGYKEKQETFFVSIEEACIIKLSANAALATKIILFNSIYQICQDYNVEYDAVRSAVGMDNRIGLGHTFVPSPDDGQLGFGGHCLPKDIKAISKIDKLGLFEHIEKINYELGR